MSDKVRLSALRRSNRYRVVLNLPVRLGRKDGTLVDISATGALATHTGVMKVGTAVEMAFTFESQKFTATANVEACTVVGLGAGENGGTLYASKLVFTNLPEASAALLQTLVASPGAPTW